ncbi:hypothetical protein [Streptomyces sp. NBC_00557]|jgi:acyl carrier protein|uniref:hypothetical protein n=2 Tax=Streptomyces TaxID=1883 RepID=UPI002E8241A6|nr:hypothetical protein [Streptomyces sp. NBC_00557]WUC40323.1 phosphopantetheine-binding protein [Streptomyces sp. NBC_00557]
MMPSIGTDALRASVREVVLRLAPDRPAQATAELLLREDLGYDSLALAELAFALEEIFQLPPLPGEETADVNSVADLEALVTGLAERGGTTFDEERVRKELARLTPQGAQAGEQDVT